MFLLIFRTYWAIGTNDTFG